MDRISALMDGELDEREAQSTIVRLKDDGELRIRWDEFHLVRDALRGDPLLSAGFDESLSKRLAEEPTVLAPRRTASQTRRATTYAMSAAASVSAAALVAWVALSPNSPSGVQPKGFMEAKQSTPAKPNVDDLRPVVVPYDGRANDYLFMHEAVSPSGTLQGLAPYVRSVSSVPAERR